MCNLFVRVLPSQKFGISNILLKLLHLGNVLSGSCHGCPAVGLFRFEKILDFSVFSVNTQLASFHYTKLNTEKIQNYNSSSNRNTV